MPTRSSDPHPDDGAQSGIAFRPALMAAGAGVWDYDADEDRLCYCRGASRILGLPADVRFDGLPLDRLAAQVHPDDRTACLAQFARRHEGGLDIAVRTIMIDGGSRDVLLRGRFEAGEDGRLRGRGILIEFSGDPSPRPRRGPEAASPLSALLAGADLVLAARKAMQGMEPSARAVATAAVDDLLMVLGRQLAATVAVPPLDEDRAGAH